MNINNLVSFINDKLAGEQLMYDQLIIFLNEVVDDINTALNSNYPVFSDFNETYEQYPNYDFFPDRYIRTVVIPGVASKFYATDEEGIDAATKYSQDYTKNLFYMVRDYSHQVPDEYRAEHQGYMIDYTSKEDFDRGYF